MVDGIDRQAIDHLAHSRYLRHGPPVSLPSRDAEGHRISDHPYGWLVRLE
ncbi:MAG TPA: hypothetical protein VFO41_11830 [Alphaproteobacteria bacterium]|nr:hypothetical protein [Alphaproteobacteria bacterium]